MEQKKTTTTELIKKELGLKTASGYPDKDKVGNFSVEQIIKISKLKEKDILHRNFKSVVKSVAGSCNSLGVLIEGMQSGEFCRMVNEGKFDKEINAQKTDVPQDKKEILKQQLEDYKKSKSGELEELKKKKEAAAEKKAAGAAGAEGGEKKEEEKKEEPKKEEKGKK
jgi:hypothetical protein